MPNCRRLINATLIYGTMHDIDLLVSNQFPCLHPFLLPPLPPSFPLSSPHFFSGEQNHRRVQASWWKLTREAPFRSWVLPFSRGTRCLMHLPFRELLAQLPGTPCASQTSTGRVFVWSEPCRRSFYSCARELQAAEEWCWGPWF